MNPKNPMVLRGRKAERICKEMFEAAGFEVEPFGYEVVLPRLAELQALKAKDNGGAKIPKHVRNMPDFVVIDLKNLKTKFVEIKRRKCIDPEDVIKTAKKYGMNWSTVLIVFATDDGFYAGYASTLASGDGKIDRLSTSFVPLELQNEALIKLKK